MERLRQINNKRRSPDRKRASRMKGLKINIKENRIMDKNKEIITIDEMKQLMTSIKDNKIKYFDKEGKEIK